MAKHNPYVIVIRCGGAGTRLWPMSRHQRPKQFQPLLGGASLFESKLEEIRPLIHSWNDVFVSTSVDYVAIIRKLAPKIPLKNIIAEPVRRNTGPGIALETAIIARRYAPQDPIIMSLTVDDVMLKRKLFTQVLQAAARYLQKTDPEAIVTIACPPDGADSGLSYLVLGETVARGNSYTLSDVTQWVEKPDLVKLRKLLKRSNVGAHTGLYIWRASTVLSIIQHHHPIEHGWLTKIADASGRSDFRQVLNRTFKKFSNVSVEEFITKYADRVVAGFADLRWRDTGKWFLVHELRRAHPGANVTEGQVITVDTSDSLIYAPPGKVVATIGLDNVVVVDTGDALLVCSKNKSADVKQVIEALEKLRLHKHL